MQTQTERRSSGQSSWDDRTRIAGTTLRGLVLLAALAGLLFPAHAADENFHQIYPLAAGGSFALENVNGSVQVEGWGRDEVEVSAVKTATRSDSRDAVSR